MDTNFLKEEVYTHTPCFKSKLFLLKKNKDKSDSNMSKTDGPNLSHHTRGTSETHWFSYIMYLHVLILYFLLFSLYNELRRTKERSNEFHMDMIDISIKVLEVEKNCLSEISNLKKSIKDNNIKRIKREILFDSSNLETSSIVIDRSVGLNANSSANFSESDIPQERHPRRVSNDRRGKKKNKRKNKRRRGHGVPKASHFIGAFPDPLIKDGGVLAPWLVDKDAIKDFNLVTKVPSRGREAVEIIENGLYFIYAQVYYITPKPEVKAHSSFSIMRRSGEGIETALAHCATLGDSSGGGDASCFTATAYSLSAGDLLFIKQRERDRNIIMKKGQTFLGLILLNKK